MSPPPLPVSDCDPRFGHNDENFRESGWGIHSEGLPTLWTNYKSWVQRISDQVTSAFAKFLNMLIESLPFNSSARSFVTGRQLALTALTTSSNVLFVLLCCLWYIAAALTANTGKAILTQFRYPITITFVQFGFVAFYCLLFMSPVIRFSKLRKPTKTILQSSLPIGIFQVGSHIFASIAISKIPVSMVHTIKALSPLITVAAYRLLFGVSYSSRTYISLLPLTLGVMLACSFDVSASNIIGLFCAFGSSFVDVSSNIFFKKIMPSNTTGSTSASTHELDKVNLLLYSSGMAFLLMAPFWVYYDLLVLMPGTPNGQPIPQTANSLSSHSVGYYLFMNGIVNFAQNIIAFIVLSSTSPVTYSIASLIKRVAVICIAIAWFKQSILPVQALGICMTFIGLYMYNVFAKGDVEEGEKKLRRIEAAKEMIPITEEESRMMLGVDTPPNESELPHQCEPSGSWNCLRPWAGSVPIRTYGSEPVPSPAIHTGIKTNLKDFSIPKENPGIPDDLYPSPPLSLPFKTIKLPMGRS